MNDLPVTLDSWHLGAVALALLAATLATTWLRRPAVPRGTLVLAAVGAALLALAAGGLTALRPAGTPVEVWVDLSPSTRGAEYRDSGKLDARVRELIGNTPYGVRFFAEGGAERAAAGGPTLPDIPAGRTVLPTTAAPALLLFSDGRLSAPDVLPPLYVVVDPALEVSADAAVTSLDVRDGTATIGVRNSGERSRALSLDGVDGEGTTTAERGAFTVARRLAPNAATVSATFAPGDVWPENDSLRSVVPPPAEAERWWVGSSAPAGGWRPLSPSQLPADAGAYLGAAVIVLDKVPADALDDARRAALRRYVQDLGGGLVILGGDRAFAAGGYAGTVLDDLSPLASTPPEPTTHWVLLADASGSMNQPAGGGGRTRWQYAVDAVAGAVKQLPPADLLSVGSFAGQVRWWSRGTPATKALAGPLPPPDVQPRGQTNLDAALREVAAQAEGGLPTEFLVATDAQAEINAPDDLARQLREKRVRLHVLLIGDSGDAKGAAALRSITDATGGTFRAERLPENWAAGLRELLRAAQSPGLARESVGVRFLNELASLGRLDVSAWNRTWPKAGVTPLAEADPAAKRLTMAARWNVGEGRAGAAAFSPPAEVSDALARLVERPPRDPRFRVTWDTAGSTVRVVVGAIQDKTYLNGERLTLDLDGTSPPRPIRQTGPGRYELTFDAPRQPAIARLRHDGNVLDARALAGCYPAEFDAVGNDRAALAALAARTGGAVIEPGVTRRLDLPRPRRRVPLVSFLATAGAVLVGAGLVRWRIGE